MDLAELAHRLESLEEYVAKQRERELISAKWEGEVAQRLKNMTTSISSLNDSISKLTIKVESLFNKPSQRWDTVITSILSALVAFVVAKFTAGI